MGKKPGPAKGKGGRPTVLTPAIHQIIVDAITIGMYEAEAARLAGIDKTTLSKWKVQAAKKAGTPYSNLFNDMRDAMVKGEFNLATTVAGQARTDGRLALEVLSRKFPERWGRRDTMRFDPKHPLPITGAKGTVLILPDNGRGDGPGTKPKTKAA
jgi:hypothetical protein